ncbi:hypothetical protein KBA41_03970 [Candidatus Ozemobacteraceae bacterium]|nr:hypothetical protein [Candidatus Ozemobacteraceae bacterium]
MSVRLFRAVPILLAAVLALLVALPSGLSAEPLAPVFPNTASAPAGLISERIRYIPFTDFQQLMERNPRFMLLPREAYDKMKDAKDAFLARHPSSPLPLLDLDFVFGGAEYRVTVRNRIATVEGRIWFGMPNPRWALLQLAGGDLGYEWVRLDGHPVGIIPTSFSGIQDDAAPRGQVELLQKRYNDSARVVKSPSARPQSRREPQNSDFMLAVKGPDRHEISFRFLCPQVDDPERNEITFRLPRVPMNRIEVFLDQADQFGEIDRAEGIDQRSAGEGTWFSGILGPTDRCTIRWAPRTAPALDQEPEDAALTASAPAPALQRPEEPARLLAETLVLHSIGEGFVRSETRLNLNITRSAADQAVLRIPSGTEILDVRSERLAGHEIETGSETRLICRFTSRIKGQISIELTSETRMTDVAQLLSLPVTKVLGAERDQGYIGIEARTSIEIRKTEGIADLPKVTPVDVTDLPAELSGLANRPILLAFRYLEPPLEPPLQLDVVRHADVPVLNAVIDSLDGTTVFTSDGSSVTCLDMRLKNNGEQYLAARITSGSEILSTALDGAPVTASTRGSDTCLIPIGTARTASSGKNGFTVRLVYKSPAPVSGLIYKQASVLPTLDLDVMGLSWRVYAPDRYDLIARPSNLSSADRPIRIAPFEVVSAFFSGIASSEGLIFIVVVLFIGLIWHRIKASNGFSWRSVFELFGVLCVILVLASISGPMLSSITDQGYTSMQKARMFSKVHDISPATVSLGEEERQDEAKDVEYGSQRQSMRSDMADKKFERMADSMDALGGKGIMMKGDAKPKAARRAPGRDIGALPVDMKIPTGGKSVVVFRNHLPAGQAAKFKGIIFWEPIRTGLKAVMFLAGLLFALPIWLSAQRRSPTLGALFAVTLISAIAVVEHLMPKLQFAAWAAFFLVFALLLVARKLFAARPEGTPGTSAVAGTVILFVLSGLAPAISAEPPAADPRVERMLDLYVPYSQLGDRLPRDSDFVALSIDEYNYLRDIGIPDPDPSRWYPPLGVTFVNASYTARVTKDRVDISLKFEAVLSGKGFKQLEFPTEGVGVKSVTINGVPALLAPETQQTGSQRTDLIPRQQLQNDIAMTQQAVQQVQNVSPLAFHEKRSVILADWEGPVLIEAELVKDLTSKTRTNAPVDGFRLPVPVYGPAVLNLVIDHPNQAVEIKPGVITRSVDTGGSTVVTAVLQPAPAITVEWRDKAATPDQQQRPASEPVPAASGIARVAVDHEVLFSVSEGVISANDLVRLQIDQHPAGEFLFEIPAGADVIEVNGSDIASWLCVQLSDGKQELRIQLNARRMNQVELRITMERQTPAINGSFPLDLPRLRSAGARSRIDRQNGYFGVEVREGLEVRVEHSSEATGIDASELPTSMTGSVRGFMAQAFKYQKDATASMTVTKHRNLEVSTAQIDAAVAKTVMNADGEALTRLDLVVRNNNNQFLVLRSMPEQLKILALEVNGEAMKPGRSKDGEIYVPLIRSPRSGKTYTPFGVTIFFSEEIGRLRNKGHFELHLPMMSLDVSQMNWKFDLPEGFFMARLGGEFQHGWESLPEVPSQVYSGAIGGKMASNVMSQMMPRGMPAGSPGVPRSSAGLLPVIPTLPEGSDSLLFHRKLITTGSRAPRLVIFHARKAVVEGILLAIVLFIGFIASSAIFGFAGGRIAAAGFKAALLGLCGAAAMTGESMFAQDLPWFDRILDAYILGIEVGCAFAFVWWLLSPPIPSEEPSKPKGTSVSQPVEALQQPSIPHM